MLTRLFIQNLATVEKQIIEFDGGFTALTGETGAGKTIIVRAVNLILGEKCPKDLIRANKDFLSVEAVFSLEDNPAAAEQLRLLDIEHDGQVSIRRKVHLNGRNSVFVNDYTIKLNQLAELGRHLVDLHGQHSQQALLYPASHIDFLDHFARLREQVQTFQEVYQRLQQLRKKREDLEMNAAERNRQIDFLRFQIDEIDKAGFSEAEEAQLNRDFQLLSHAEQVVAILSPIAQWNADSGSPLTEIAGALQPLQTLLQFTPELKRFADEINSGLITLEEAVMDINRYLSQLEVNPQRLETVNERLAELDSLKRKYGGSLTEIMIFRESRCSELAELEELETNQGELDKEIAELEKTVDCQALELSRKREKQALVFAKRVQSNLQELGLERSRFQIDLKALPEDSTGRQTYSSKGRDRVEFLITTNPGHPLKPLAKIASGGEISRIMLSIKTSLNEDLSRGTMVFDEVDAGISGRVADSVGVKLDQLGRQRQVICITHSPQIAAKACAHLKVEKVFEKNNSKTLITTLSGDARVEEIARFLGGDKVTEKTMGVARDMLKKG